MKTAIRLLAAGMFLAAYSSVHAAVQPSQRVPAVQPAAMETGQMVVSQKSALSARELAKYKQREQALKEETKRQAAGEGMDTSTMVIIGVLVVVVIVAVASGGGSGGGSGY
jgi:uncharacterized membrane protein YidH (DUF202 family)